MYKILTGFAQIVAILSTNIYTYSIYRDIHASNFMSIQLVFTLVLQTVEKGWPTKGLRPCKISILILSDRELQTYS